jgi:hypothetical protein
MSAGQPTLTVRVHDRWQAASALETAASSGCGIRLTSSDQVAATGVGYWRALEELLGQPILVDCGGDAGLVLGGLRAGLRSLLFTGDPALRAKLEEIAAELGGRIASRLEPPCVSLSPEDDAVPILQARLAGAALGSASSGV